MSPTHAQEDFAEALCVERLHADSGLVFIAEQIGALALEGGAAGIAPWQAIAAAYEQLRKGQLDAALPGDRPPVGGHPGQVRRRAALTMLERADRS